MATKLDSDVRLSDAEALMWRLERRDPMFRVVIAVVVPLDHSPGIDGLRHRAGVLAAQLPRFGQRVAPSGPALAPWWEPAPDFDVADHVDAVRATGQATLDDVLAMAGPLVARGLDRSRPLWAMTLVEGMAAGRAAVVIRLHHTFTDGLGAVKLAMILFDLDADAPAPDLPDIEQPRRPGDLRRAVEDLRHEVGAGAGLARRAVPAVRGLLRDALGAPERRADALSALAGSLRRTLAPSTRPGSPLMTGRSAASVFGALRVELDDAREVARAAGVTVNDVFLSAVVAGVARYHAHHGAPLEVLRVGMPVSLRAAGDDSLRNQFFPGRLMLPAQIDDPVDRLRAVHELALAARAEPALGAYGPVAAAAVRFAPADELIGRALRSVDVMASNVVGSGDTLHLAGSRLLGMVPFGPRSGAGLNLTTLSYDGVLHVGVNMDPAATPDTATLMHCLRQAFAEVVIYV